MKVAGRAILWLAAAFVVAQFVRLGRPNPPVSRDVGAPPEVESALRRACYDCHSNETLWPWYTHVAPASWLVYHDVIDGRRHVNFSTWDKYQSDAGTMAKKFKEIRKTLAEDEMPPWYYSVIHPPARLSSADRGAITRWAEAGMAGLGQRADSSSEND